MRKTRMASGGMRLARWPARRLWCGRSYATRLKFYKEKPKYYKDVAQTYARFRREVSELRRGFREQWTEQQRMTQTQFSAKAAEEARQKEMEETRAFEAAAQELERMAKEREASEQIKEEGLRVKREKGAISRQQREEEIHERVTRQEELMETARSNGITAENMDEKIREALENDILEDFIISPANGEKKLIKYKNIH